MRGVEATAFIVKVEGIKKKGKRQRQEAEGLKAQGPLDPCSFAFFLFPFALFPCALAAAAP